MLWNKTLSLEICHAIRNFHDIWIPYFSDIDFAICSLFFNQIFAQSNRVSDGITQFVEHRLEIERLLVQCLNWAFCHRKNLSYSFPNGAKMSTLPCGPVRLRTELLKTYCVSVVDIPYAGWLVHMREVEQ